jgi:polyisoprenoid-binding protein YceI
VSGTLTIDPEKPEATKGTITIDAKTLNVENDTMKEHLLGADWMDVEKHPSISFTVTGLEDFEMKDGTASANVKGTFSVKGVEKEISVPAKVTLLPDKLGARTGGKMEGDLLVIRTEFTIKRTDYGINPGAPTDKVSDEVVIKLAIAGASPK